MIFMGKWLARSNVMTTAEWMEFRFGSGKSGQAARILSAISNIVVVIGMIIYFAEGTGKFLSIFLPWSPEICSILMITAGVIYTSMSGLYGVIFTDIVQEIIIITASVYIAGKAIFLPNHREVINFAGEKWNTLSPDWTAEPMHWLHNPDIYSLFGVCIMFWIIRGIFEGMGGFSGGYLAQRFYASKGDKNTGLLTFQWITLLSIRWPMIIGLAFLGMSLAFNNPEIAAILNNDPEKTMPVVVAMLLPAGIKGIVIAGFIAAAMSTFDSTVNAGASYWVRDIYPRYINPEAAENQLVKQSWMSSVLIAAIGAVIAFSISSINEIWNWITGALSAGLFAPLILRWYWWRFNGTGFAVSTGVRLVSSILISIIYPEIPFYISFITVLTLSLTAGITSSLLTRPTDKKVLLNFYKKIKPFGFWEPVRSQCNINFVDKVKSENTRDIINTFFAVIFHLNLFLSGITLVLHKWDIMFTCSILFILSGIFLYFNWYKYLNNRDSDDVNIPETKPCHPHAPISRL
ncbi:MAG: sodium:solute symporter [Candidatus Aenigmarchaeota archaeon]|nr:sodium:solute symporter [Candidatus Aenigmarchaeota archaeon]